MEYNAQAHSLQCPKCGHGMIEIEHGGVAVDRCSHCQGLWFDVGEADQLKLIEGSEQLDIGDPEQGWRYDTVGEINCPRCGKNMEQSADPAQTHIWYETCAEHGLFMDAGEFSDFKEENFLDWFRAIVKGER